MADVSLNDLAQQGLNRFIVLIRCFERYFTSSTYQTRLADLLQRFKLWVGNTGALYEPANRKSLAHQVRAAPKLKDRFLELLVDARDDQIELQSLFVENLKNSTFSDPKFDLAFDSLIETLDETLRALFKASGTIRRTVKRDPYATALRTISATEISSDDWDLELIGDLFPRLCLPENQWLQNKLAKANNMRRRYLWYCKNKQTELKGVNDWKWQVPDPLQDIGSLNARPDEANFNSLSEYDVSSASTAGSGAFESAQIGVDNVESQDSSSSETTSSTRRQAYQVIDLNQVNDGLGEFKCPYCRESNRSISQRQWTKHVFSDIKAYVCLDQQCEPLLFESSHSWLHHHQSVHLTRYTCPYCEGHQEFQEFEHLKTHMGESHIGKFHEQQLDQICTFSKEMPEMVSASTCPFCNWGRKLLRRNGKPEDLVSIQSFRRHVGSHMEQAALTVFVEEPDTSVKGGHSLTSHSQRENRRYTGRACRRCHEYKISCDYKQPCVRCISIGHECRVTPRKQLKPLPGKIASRGSSGKNITDHSHSTPKISDEPEYSLHQANPDSDQPNDEEQPQEHPAQFQCGLCSKRFTRAHNLKSHMLTHTEAPTVKCTVCDRKFSREDNMRAHVRRIHMRESNEES